MFLTKGFLTLATEVFTAKLCSCTCDQFASLQRRCVGLLHGLPAQALDQRLHYAKRSRQDLCAPVCLPKHGGHRCTSCCQTSQWEDSSGLVGKCKSDSLHLNGQSWKAGHSANGPERIPSLIKHFFRGLRAPSNAETEPSLRDPGAAAGGPTSGDPPNRLSEPVRGSPSVLCAKSLCDGAASALRFPH